MKPAQFSGSPSDRSATRFNVVAVVVLLVGTLVFFSLASEVFEGETEKLDDTVLMAMRVAGDPSDPIGPGWLEELFRDFTALGGTGVLTLLTLGTFGYLWMIGVRRAALYLLLAIAGGLMLSLLLKNMYARPRPDLISYGSVVYTSSFPSGHSMMSAIVYLTGGAMLATLHQARSVRWYLIACASLVTLLVGCSRVYLGVHWPTDVLAGWAIGAAWAALCWLIAQRLQAIGYVEKRQAAGADIE